MKFQQSKNLSNGSGCEQVKSPGKSLPTRRARKHKRLLAKMAMSTSKTAVKT